MPLVLDKISPKRSLHRILERGSGSLQAGKGQGNSGRLGAVLAQPEPQFNYTLYSLQYTVYAYICCLPDSLFGLVLYVHGARCIWKKQTPSVERVERIVN